MSRDTLPSAIDRLDAVVSSNLDACAPDCADCAFNTHEDAAWDYCVAVVAREFYGQRRARVNARRATPFVSDFQTREIFETVATLDCL